MLFGETRERRNKREVKNEWSNTEPRLTKPSDADEEKRKDTERAGRWSEREEERGERGMSSKNSKGAFGPFLHHSVLLVLFFRLSKHH